MSAQGKLEREWLRLVSTPRGAACVVYGFTPSATQPEQLAPPQMRLLSGELRVDSLAAMVAGYRGVAVVIDRELHPATIAAALRELADVLTTDETAPEPSVDVEPLPAYLPPRIPPGKGAMREMLDAPVLEHRTASSLMCRACGVFAAEVHAVCSICRHNLRYAVVRTQEDASDAYARTIDHLYRLAQHGRQPGVEHTGRRSLAE